MDAITRARLEETRQNQAVADAARTRKAQRDALEAHRRHRAAMARALAELRLEASNQAHQMALACGLDHTIEHGVAFLEAVAERFPERADAIRSALVGLGR